MVTGIGSHVWNKLTPDEQKLFADTLKEAASKATEAIEASERFWPASSGSSARP
jgi:TRAP-type C4-dicarboxylate transport system substrate-binding protein